MKVLWFFFFILRHIFKMICISLCRFLEAQHKILHDAPINQSRDGSNLLSDDFLEFCDGYGYFCVHSVFKVSKEKEIWWAKVWAVRRPRKIRLEIDQTATKVLFQPTSGRFEVWELAPYCWNQNFPIGDGYRICSSLLKVLRTSSYRSLVTVTVSPY